MSDSAYTNETPMTPPIVPGRNEYSEEEMVLAIERDVAWQEDKRRIVEKWER